MWIFQRLMKWSPVSITCWTTLVAYLDQSIKSERCTACFNNSITIDLECGSFQCFVSNFLNEHVENLTEICTYFFCFKRIRLWLKCLHFVVCICLFLKNHRLMQMLTSAILAYHNQPINSLSYISVLMTNEFLICLSIYYICSLLHLCEKNDASGQCWFSCWLKWRCQTWNPTNASFDN